jgi:hypothetical protein
MKTIRTFIFATIAMLAASCTSANNTGTADQALESCGTAGDQDGDLVPDLLDSSQTDSCLLDPNNFGFNDCTTGAGDGIPDCE